MGLRNRNLLSEEQFFFVTTSVYNFINIFSDEKYCDLLIHNIKHYQNKYQFNILGYVIMPTHFHWIVKTNPLKGTISNIMRDIKKYSAWDIMELLEKEHSMRFNKFTSTDKPKQKRQFWQHRFDDEVIRNNKMFWTKLKYIHNNPVNAGLVTRMEDYKYSSARNYILNDHSIIKVDTEWGGVEIV
jgi:putative transposase